MESLTDLLGFEARFVVYPVAALVIAGIVRVVVHRFLERWASKTKSKVDDQVVAYIKNLTTPLLLIIILYYLSAILPLADKPIRYLRETVFIVGIVLVAYFSARLMSSILRVLAEEREGLSKFSHPLRMLSNVFFLLVGIALILRRLNVNLGTEGARFVRVIGIAAGAFVVLKIVRLAVDQMERMVEDEDTGNLSETEKRARTLGKIINDASLVLVI